MDNKPVQLLAQGRRGRPLTLVVFAPFGHDKELSDYPDGQTLDVRSHPLVAALQGVAREGANVVALIDRCDDYTWLLEIPAFGRANFVSTGKQDMGSPRALSALLMHAMRRHKGSAIALALEGHGAGYLPELDMSKLQGQRRITEPGSNREFIMVQRPNEQGGSIPADESGNTLLPMTEPLLPMTEPLLPMTEPLLPGYPMSTWATGWALGEAIRQCKADKLVAVHFNNCFNMSTELLAEIAPHALWATGYSNYNFFTAGRGYPEVMRKFRSTARKPEDLARLFALLNQSVLSQPPMTVPHPTIGSAVDLQCFEPIVGRLHDMADALRGEMAPLALGSQARTDMVERIRRAIAAAQQYDANGSFVLEVPDALTDLLALAKALAGSGLKSAGKAQALVNALQPGGSNAIKVYGDNAVPYVNTNTGNRWDFSSPDLALNIYLPDPDRRGIWDWRSPFFFAKKAGQLPAQPQVCRLLVNTAWVDFVYEYHRGVAFAGLLAPPKLVFPLAWLPGATKPPGPLPVPQGSVDPRGWGCLLGGQRRPPAPAPDRQEPPKTTG